MHTARTRNVILNKTASSRERPPGQKGGNGMSSRKLRAATVFISLALCTVAGFVHAFGWSW